MINNIRVKTKMLILNIVIIISIILTTGYSIYNLDSSNKTSLRVLEESVRKEYDDNIKNQVTGVVTLLDHIYKEYEAGEYTLEEAQKLGADLVRSMRYGEDGYFWIDTVEGVNIVSLDGEAEGTNRFNVKDHRGSSYIKALINVARQEEGGYVDYHYLRPGKEEPSPMRSYSRLFKPFNWVVGTGNYVDDMDDLVQDYGEEINGRAQQALINLILGVIFILIFVGVFTIYIAISIVNVLKDIKERLGKWAKGDFTAELPSKLIKRKDDFGELATAMEVTKQAIKLLVGGVQGEVTSIERVVNEVNKKVILLNNGIEEIASTTEELSASMEETAASSEEMAATSREIQHAIKDITEKSQQGAGQAEQINKRATKIKQETQQAKEKSVVIHHQIRDKLYKALEKAQVVEQIQRLSDSIMNITKQTNLLALNASIEAARAGDAGKGFAVVATEITNLANQSKNTVIQIQEITENVIEAVSHLAQGSKELLEYVGTDVSKDYDAFLEVVDAYSEDANYVDELVTDFSSTAQELMASIDNIMVAIDEVTKATAEGAMGTTNIAQKNSNIMVASNEVVAGIEESMKSSLVLQKEISQFSI